ncbi:MAG TPA: hypothetical protein VN814_13955 [Caulobacteraceae bacterium]|nr:hypothetical protein [Caulobacteraceae bacterium]
MTWEDMSEERFLTLAAAYGADMARWPSGDRAAAEAFVAANPKIVEACLAAERLLDAALERYRERDAAAPLRARIIAAAPRERAAGAMWRWLTGAGLGLGLAASCAAGVAAGYTLGHPAVARLMGPALLDSGQLSAVADPAGDAAAS